MPKEKQPQEMPGNNGFVIPNDKVIDSEGRGAINANNEPEKPKGLFSRIFGK